MEALVSQVESAAIFSAGRSKRRPDEESEARRFNSTVLVGKLRAVAPPGKVSVSWAPITPAPSLASGTWTCCGQNFLPWRSQALAHPTTACLRSMSTCSSRFPAETLEDPYYKRVPLPRITGYRKLDREAQLANMVHTSHWHDTLHRNAVFISRRLAREANYANQLNTQQVKQLYRAQSLYA